MRLFRNKKGLILVEVLIAISLFAVVVTVANRILADIARLEKRSSVETLVFDDLRMIMQQLTYEIQHATIDYEEYYNYYVLQDAENALEPKDTVYMGLNYGVYGSRFYDPGMSLDGDPTENPKDLGIECSYPNSLPGDQDCEVIYSLSLDHNTVLVNIKSFHLYHTNSITVGIDFLGG